MIGYPHMSKKQSFIAKKHLMGGEGDGIAANKERNNGRDETTEQWCFEQYLVSAGRPHFGTLTLRDGWTDGSKDLQESAHS